MADSACFWDHPWHRRIRPVSHAVRKCILDTLHGSLLRRRSRLCHYPDVHFPSPCKIRQHDRRYVQKRIVYRCPFPVLYGIDGSYLLRYAADRSPHLHPGSHFRGGLMCTALLLPAVQYPEPLSGKDRRPCRHST